MTNEMIADNNYTPEQRHDDRSETLASLTGKMEEIIGKTNNKIVSSMLECFLKEADMELEDRYRKRKK